MKKQKKNAILTNSFDYYLPTELIGQEPTKPRDQARLLILDRETKKIKHHKFYQLIDEINPGDVIVLNDSKVIPARLKGKKETGGQIEIFLLKKIKARTWECLIGGRIKMNDKVFINQKISGQIIKKSKEKNLIRFNSNDKDILACGETPTPPYIKKKANLSDYQTVYSSHLGSAAAPTAGLHFTKSLLKKLQAKGIKIEYVTLHVGLGTFAPVKSKYINNHQIHTEFASITKQTANRLNRIKKSGHKIIACGTTTVRTLEAFADKRGMIRPGQKQVNIFIYPGYTFKFVNQIITNFHLPKSTLIILVSAFAGTNKIKKAYQQAIRKKYKFYSFGDAMLIK